METIPPTEVTPHLVRDALRHRWLLIVGSILALTALGTFLGLSQQPSYTSTTTILLKPTVGNPLSPDSAKSSPQITVAMSTEAGLVNSPAVTQLVNQKLKTDLPPASTAVTTVVPVSTQILQITATAPTAQDAQRQSAAYADSYLAYRAAQSKQILDAQTTDLTAQIKAASDGLKQATTDAGGVSPPADAVARLQLYSNRLATVQDALTTLKSASNDPGMTVTPASAPTATGIPGWAYGLGGAFLGIALGLLLALWRERNDDRVRFDGEVSVAGIPVLASRTGDDTADAEATRQLRSAVIRLAPRSSVLAVVPIAPSGPRGLAVRVGGELAGSLSRAGYRIAVIDATMEPDAAGPGLSDWLVDRAAENSLAQIGDVRDGVLWIGGGTRSGESRDLLAGERFAAAVRELSSSFDYVLVTGESPAGGPSGGDLALVATHALAVGVDRSTTLGQVTELLQRTTRTGPAVVGLVAASRVDVAALTGSETSGARARPTPDAPGSAAATSGPVSGPTAGQAQDSLAAEAPARPGRTSRAAGAHRSTATPGGASADGGERAEEPVSQTAP